jgi:hypothetical protein
MESAAGGQRAAARSSRRKAVKRMSLYKRGEVYWYEFRFNGARVQESAQTGNKDAARQIEAAHRVRLAKGEAGIKDRVRVPTLADFAPRFEAAIETLCGDKPATVVSTKKKCGGCWRTASYRPRGSTPLTKP